MSLKRYSFRELGFRILEYAIMFLIFNGCSFELIKYFNTPLREKLSTCEILNKNHTRMCCRAMYDFMCNKEQIDIRCISFLNITKFNKN